MLPQLHFSHQPVGRETFRNTALTAQLLRANMPKACTATLPVTESLVRYNWFGTLVLGQILTGVSSSITLRHRRYVHKYSLFSHEDFPPDGLTFRFPVFDSPLPKHRRRVVR